MFGELPSSFSAMAMSLVWFPNGYNSSNVIPSTTGINTMNTMSTRGFRISNVYSSQLQYRKPGFTFDCFF